MTVHYYQDIEKVPVSELFGGFSKENMQELLDQISTEGQKLVEGMKK